MNILVVGKKNHIPWVEFVANGFKDNRCNVNIFYINKLSSSTTFKKNILKYIDKKSSNKIVANELNKIIKKTKPDMVFFVSTFFIPIELYKTAKEYDCYIASWSGDKFGPEIFEYAQYIDKLYVYETAFIQDAHDAGFKNVNLLQKAYDKNIHFDKNLIRRKYASFIGSHSFERDNIFSQLTDYNLELHGIKWNKMSAKGQRWKIYNGILDSHKVAQVYNETLVTINIIQSVNVYGGVGMRIFEAAACGCCVITEPLADLELAFEIDKEILVFEEIDQLKFYLDKLNTNPEFFHKISRNIKKKFLSEDFTYKSRMKDVLIDMENYND